MEAKPCPFCGGLAKTNAIPRGRVFAWCVACSTSPTPLADWNRRADPAPTAEYLLGYSQAVLRAARGRAEREYGATMDDCGDRSQAWRNAIEEVWPRLRSRKTRDALDLWTLDAQKETDEWVGMQRPVKLRTFAEEQACEHIFESNPGMYDTSHRYCTKCGRAE